MKRASMLVLLSLIAASPSVRAQPKPTAAETEPALGEARERFLRGVDLYKEGSFDAALAEFNKAYELAPNFRVLYNMAQVQTERHDYVAALKLLTQYLKDGGTDVAADRRDQVQQEMTTLKGRVAELTVSSNVADAELVIDGVSAGNLPLEKPFLVSSGVRQIQLRKAGYVGSARTVTIASGDTVNLDFQLQPEAAPSASPAPSTPPLSVAQPSAAASLDSGANHPSHGHAGLWISAVATGLFAGGAVTFGVLTHGVNHDLDTALNTFHADPGHIANLRSQLKRDAALTDGLTAAAVVAAGFTVYFAISGSHSSMGQEPTRAALRVTPTGPSLDLVGSF